jgi:1-acyl-sn-glycerol-3-phosphate acyltransferase
MALRGIRSGVSATSETIETSTTSRQRRAKDPVPIKDDHVDRQSMTLRAILAANQFFTRYFHELIVLNDCMLPEKGPAILVCNHTAGIDPLLLQSVCSRVVVWMMAREYYDIPGLRYLFERLQMIPVERSGRDMAATRAALRALEGGRVLGVFPEGRIETDRQLLPFQTGVALLAAKSGAPVYPAYLDGTQRGREMVPALLRPGSATLAFGPEVAFDRSESGRAGLEAATAAITEGVRRLKNRCDALE